MSQNRETSHDPCHVFSLLMKVAITIFLVASASLVFFSFFSNQSRWFRCLECNGIIRNSVDRPEIRVTFTDNYERTNTSHLLFGIGGSAKTWKDRQHYSELWWKPNITRGYVWLNEKPGKDEPWPETSPPYQVSEDSSRFKYTSISRSAVRITRIVSESFRLGLDNVRWFVMGDDDTVFFVENLVAVLSKYDHRQMYYIGGSSESVEQDVMHSYGMAFGGGGFAISYPLAAVLVRVLDGCIDRYSNFYGSDQKIQGCLSEVGVSLTKELGFHQVSLFI